MIQVTPHMRILLAIEPADFRKGIDGLCRLCRSVLRTDPFGGYVFVFRNRKATSIRMLTYDGQGFCLFQKRLSQGSFKWWPKPGDGALKELAVYELSLLFWNGDPSTTEVAPDWRSLPRPEI